MVINVLDDGRYDIFVVDAESSNDGQSGTIALELTVLAGPHKGEMLTLQATGIDRDPLELLGVPGTLTVQDGQPSVRLEG